MAIQLDDLLNALADENGTPLSELIDGDPEADLDALINDAVGRYEKLDAGDVAGGTPLVNAATALVEVRDARAEAKAANDAQFDELSSRMSGLVAPVADETPAEEVEEPTAEAEPATEDAPAVEAAAPAPAAAAASMAPAPVAEPEDEEDKPKAPVVAAAAPRRAAPKIDHTQIRGNAATAPRPKQEDTVNREPVIVASADNRGIATGANLTLEETADAIFEKFRSYAGLGATRARNTVASIRSEFPAELVAGDKDRERARQAIARATDESRLPGESLVAAGGWCAPSERDYSLPEGLETNEGLVSLPEIQTGRGGIEFNRGLEFDAIYGAVGFMQTETQAEAGTAKGTARIPCADDWDEVRADAVGLSITGGIPQEKTYPEVGRRFVGGALIAHQHKINATTLARQEAGSVNVGTVAHGPNATSALLNAIGLQLTDMRYRYRAQRSKTIEVILPDWVREIIKADMSLRGNVPFAQVSDAQIDAWFRERNANVQWVVDWQDALAGGGTFGGYTQATQVPTTTAYPATAKALMYYAGTWVRGRGDIISRIALGTKVAAFAAGQLSKHLLGATSALAILGGQGVGRLAMGLRLASQFAGSLARDLGRIVALATVLQAVGRGLGMLTNLGKFAAIGTLGFSTLLGAATGVSQLLGGPLVSAITAVGAAMGVAAGAAVGILGPALVGLKVGFKGLSDGAKEFNKQFADMDEALNKRIGTMMAPLLTAWHDASAQMKLAFAGALQPAFQSMGGLINQFRPQLVGLSTTLGQVGNEVAKSLAGPAARQGFADMLAASNDFFSAFKGESGLGGLASGLVSFAGTAAKTFSGVGVGINDALLSAGEWLRNISPEQMRSAFDQVRQVFDNIAAVVGPVLSGLRQLGGISAPALAPGFKSIGDSIVQATPGIMTMARELMPALGQAMTNIAPLLPGIVDAFTPWASVVAVLAPHIATLVSHLGPLAPVILGIALAAKTITSAMVAYNAVMAIASVGQGVFAAATGAGTASLAGNTIALAAHRVATVAGTIATKAAAIAMRAFGVALRFATGPIGLIITGVALVGTAIWAFFTKTETGRKLWDTIWTGIKTAVSTVVNWFQTTALPILKSVWDGIASGATWLWQNVITPVWDGIKAVIAVAIDVIKGYINTWIEVFRTVGTVLTWLWQNIAIPVWEGIRATIQLAWDGIKVVIDGGLTVFKAIETVLLWVWHSVVEPIWEGIKTAFTTAIEGIKVIWNGLVSTAETVWNGIKTAFNSVVDFVGGLGARIGEKASGMWDGIKNAFKGAINWIIQAWNSLEFKIPGFELGPVKYGGFTLGVPDIPMLAGGGVVGAAGGARINNGRITGPGTGTSDSILALIAGGGALAVSNGESVNTEKATRNNWWLYERLNAGVPLAKALGIPGLAGGGTVGSGASITSSDQQNAWDTIRQVFPDLTLTSATRTNQTEGHPDNHNAGVAIDLSGDATTMRQAAEWIAQNFPGSRELIHQGIAHNIKNGENVGDGVSFYGAGQMAAHGDHVHWAPPAGIAAGAVEAGVGAGATTVGGDTSGGLGLGSGTGSAFSSAAAAAKGGVTPVWVENWPTGGSGTSSRSTSSSSTPAAARTSSTATPAAAKTTGQTGQKTIPLVQNADGKWTSSDPEWAKLIDRESGGDATITQQISDVNSATGDLATGLFQITGGTWKRYGGVQYAASAKDATPEQQAEIAAKIFEANNGRDWGVGLSGRESADALRAGLAGGKATPGGSTAVPAIQPTMKPLSSTPVSATPVTSTTTTPQAAEVNPIAQAAGFGQPTNKTWFEAVGSDLPSQVLGWGGDALKEVGGEVFDLVGLGGLFGKGVDFGVNAGKAGIESGKKAASAAIQAGSAGAGAIPGPGGVVAGAVAQAGQAAVTPLANTVIFQGQTTQQVASGVQRGLQADLAPVRETYR